MIFSKDIVFKRIWNENPVLIQSLGLCSVLGGSGTVKNALSLGLATTFVLLLSNLMSSSTRPLFSKEGQWVLSAFFISSLVGLVDSFFSIYLIEQRESLGIFLPLIMMNVFVLGRFQIFASQNSIWNSTKDALGVGIGFSLVLFIISCIRELGGFGSLWGIKLLGEDFQTWDILKTPGGAYLLLGLMIFLFVHFQYKNKEKRI